MNFQLTASMMSANYGNRVSSVNDPAAYHKRRNETILQAINMTAPGGRICMVGNPYTDMKLDKQGYWKLLCNQLEVTGTWNSSFFSRADEKGNISTDWTYVLRLLEQERIAPERLISYRFDLEHLEKGLHIMRDKSEDYLKIMTVCK